MRDVPAIIYTQTDRDVAVRAVEDQWHRVRFVEQREEKTLKKAEDARVASDKAKAVADKAKLESDGERRELGFRLIAARATFPAKGARKGDPFGLSWSAWLDSIGIDRHFAKRCMQMAGFTEEERADDESAHTSSTEADTSASNSDEGSNSESANDNAEPERRSSAEQAASEPRADRSGGRGKPQWLMRALVADYSMRGDLVCDPLAGWGSTLIASLAEGRRAIGSELDPKIAADAGELPIHIGDWRTALSHVGEVDAIITDPPYSARTHAASRKFGNAREDGSPLDGLGPEYAAWTRDHVFEFVRHWSPRCRGWMVALTDHNLIHDWQDAYEEQGRYSFAPVICLIRGMTVRLCGDGPSSWAIYAMVARPVTYSRWRTLSGGYVGSRDKLEIGADA